MDPQLLQSVGLTEAQAKAYILLVKNGEIKPPSVAAKLGTTRTNAYKIFEQLEEMGLAKRLEKDKKLTYFPQNPAALEKLAAESRKAVVESEQRVKSIMPTLLNYFFTFSEQPGVRFYQGEEGIKEIYEDQIRTKQPVYIIRPSLDVDILEFNTFSEIRHRQRKAGIWRHAIIPDHPKAPKNYKESDPFMLVDRTWLKPGAYTAPVEWNAYGDKVAILSSGEEFIGMIIHSPQIAEAFRQIHALLQVGIKRDKDYDKLPRLARYEASTAIKTNR